LLHDFFGTSGDAILFQNSGNPFHVSSLSLHLLHDFLGASGDGILFQVFGNPFHDSRNFLVMSDGFHGFLVGRSVIDSFCIVFNSIIDGISGLISVTSGSPHGDVEFLGQLSVVSGPFLEELGIFDGLFPILICYISKGFVLLEFEGVLHRMGIIFVNGKTSLRLLEAESVGLSSGSSSSTVLLHTALTLFNDGRNGLFTPSRTFFLQQLQLRLEVKRGLVGRFSCSWLSAS